MAAIVEADDGGMCVLEFRGAGQGAKALVAERIASRSRASASTCCCHRRSVFARVRATVATLTSRETKA